MYIVGQATEERNAIANQHWNTRDNKVLNKPRSEKALNGYPAIYVCMPYPPSLEPRNNFDRFTRQMLYYRTSCGWSKGACAQNESRLFSVWPLIKAQYRLEGRSADHHCIHALHK